MGHGQSTQAPPLPPTNDKPASSAIPPQSAANSRALMSNHQPAAVVPPVPIEDTLTPPKPPPATTSSYWSYLGWNSAATHPASPVASTASTADATVVVPVAPVPVSLHALAPPPTAIAQKTPATFVSFLPVLGGVAVLMAGSVAYGIRYGNRQMSKVEENYADYEVKPSPKTEPEIEITPEMRRYALRRAMQAFGIGTALTFSAAAAATYGVSRYWDVRSIPELNAKLTTVIGGVRLPFESTANRIVGRFEKWMESTWIYRKWSTHTGPKVPMDQEGQQQVQKQEQEMQQLWSDAKRMQQEWNEGKVGQIGASQKPPHTPNVDTTAQAPADGSQR